jgi:phosphatidylglycerol:prolipoprotein diacylglycerol transferase
MLHPILLNIGSYPVASWGLLLTLAFGVGILLAARRANSMGLDGEAVIDCLFWIIVSGLLGGRAFWVISHWELFQPPHGSMMDVINPFRSDSSFVGLSGLSMMGGLPAGLLAAAWFFRRRKLAFFAYLDVMSPAVALGAGITRIGCFLNGCCFGLVCPWPRIGVVFPEGSLAEAAMHGASIHPVQLYASAAGFGIAGFLYWLHRRRPFEGSVVFSLCVLMGFQRLCFEFIRYNEGSEVWFRAGNQIVSVYQGVAALLMLVGIVGLVWRARVSGPPERAEP